MVPGQLWAALLLPAWVAPRRQTWSSSSVILDTQETLGGSSGWVFPRVGAGRSIS